MSLDALLGARLSELAEAGRLRDARPPLATDPARSFVSNDYLGFGGEAREAAEGSVRPNEVRGTAEPKLEAAPWGARAARLLGGDNEAHRALEEALASWVLRPAALLFTSGYAANVGALSALTGDTVVPARRSAESGNAFVPARRSAESGNAFVPARRSAESGNAFVVSDALNHASIIDGLRLAGLTANQKSIAPHNDAAAVERALLSDAAQAASSRWIVVESYYSMDADVPDLRELSAIAARTNAFLYVDEAHALGVFGDEGRGLCAAAGVVPDVLVGTFGKSLGTAGAFVAGSETLRTYLWNRARSFVFSTGGSPAVARATVARVASVRAAEDRRERLAAAVDRLRRGLDALGLPALGRGPIVPVVLGSETRALGYAAALRARGFEVFAVRPPTVAPGTSRLRLTVSAHHDAAAIDALLDALRACAQGSVRPNEVRGTAEPEEKGLDPSG